MIFKFIKNKQKGSLVVEATLVFPLVIITLLFVANILNICMVHLCMQQALNNTAKKVSQYSYLAYRIAGEKNFASVLDSLNNIDDAYSDFEDKATLTKTAVEEAQDSLNSSMESTANLLHTFDGFSVLEINDYCEKLSSNIDTFTKSWFGEKSETENEISSDFSTEGTISKFKNVQKSFSDLLVSGKKNIKSIILKFLIKTGTSLVLTPIAENIFTSYTEKMGVPASRIKETSAFQSFFNPETGAFTMVVAYKYVNPFSFINSKSMEYSVVNKNIRMANVITVKPFIGKNGTSLVKEDTNSETEEKKQYYVVTDVNKKIVYHMNYGCEALAHGRESGEGHIEKSLEYVKSKINDYRVCEKCKESEYEGAVYIDDPPFTITYHTSLDCQYVKDKDPIIIYEEDINESDRFKKCSSCHD